MTLDNIFVDFEHFRLSLSNKDKLKLDKEFNFLERLVKFLTRKVETKFKIKKGMTVSPSSLRPFVYGILKRFKESERYDFSNYSYLDHFEFAAQQIFARYETKKEKEGVLLHNFPFYSKVSIIRFNRDSFKFSWQEIEFLKSKIKGRIRPKNKNFRNFRYLYVERRNNQYYLFGQTYKEKSNEAKEEVEASIVISDFSTIKIYDSNNNFTTYNINLSRESYNVDRLTKIITYHNQTLKNNGGIISNNIVRLEKKIDDIYEKLRLKMRAKYTQVIIGIVQKYDYISIEKPANLNFSSKYSSSKVIESFLINEFYKSLKHYGEKYRCKIIYVDLGYSIKKICHKCGSFIFKDNGQAIVHCECGAVFDEDLNAAMNLLSYLINKCGLKNRLLFKQENASQLSLFG